ncbi:MAG: hypothetical protein ACXIUZ_01900 [Lysobacteraceae bacterium]
MSKKNPKLNTPIGVLMFPHLLEPDTKFNADGEYKADMRLEIDEAQGLIDKLEAIRDAYAEEIRKENKKYARYNMADVVEIIEDDSGEEYARVRAKLKAIVRVKKTGKSFTQKPDLFDAAGRPIKPASLSNGVWSGTRAKFALEVVPYAMDSSKLIGVSLRLKAVQIIELVAGGGGTAEDYGFGEEEGFDASDLPTPDETQAAGGSDAPFDEDDSDEDGDPDF